MKVRLKFPQSAVSLKINGIDLEVVKGLTLLEAARAANIYIPTLCHLPGAPKRAVCRLCLVKVKGMPGLVSSCSVPVQEGMIVDTNTFAVMHTRQVIMEMILLEHGKCGRPDCEVEMLGRRLGASGKRFSRQHTPGGTPCGSDYIKFDPALCIKCDRCIGTCYLQVISRKYRGPEVSLGFDSGISLRDSRCTACGDCVAVCPTGALRHSILRDAGQS